MSVFVDTTSAYTRSEGYKNFRSWVAQQRITLDSLSTTGWKYYDFGPKDEGNIPLILLPGTSGTAESYYKQFLSLCPKGFRLISVQYPDYMSFEAWCKGFDKFLDKFSFKKVHLFGTSLGGYMAQVYTAYNPERVQSLILSNTFSDTQYYKDNAPCIAMFPFMPEFMLKRLVLANFPTGAMETEVANSVDFMVEQLESLTGRELASRLTLNCTIPHDFNPSNMTFDKRKITIVDSLDEVAIPVKLKDEVYKFYPEAKVAELRTGGNFPFLSRSDEVNLHLHVHLRKHSQENEEEEESGQVEQPAGPTKQVQKESKEEREFETSSVAKGKNKVEQHEVQQESYKAPEVFVPETVVPEVHKTPKVSEPATQEVPEEVVTEVSTNSVPETIEEPEKVEVPEESVPVTLEEPVEASATDPHVTTEEEPKTEVNEEPETKVSESHEELETPSEVSESNEGETEETENIPSEETTHEEKNDEE